jgi:hypothetical protein
MRRPIWWALAAFFMVSGATWLISMIWRESALDLAPRHAPHIIAALITGATLARVLDRRAHAITLAAGATLVWLVLQLAAYLIHDTAPRWSAPVPGAAHYVILAAITIPAAAATASLRLVGHPDHRLLWLWISALLMLGAVVAPLTIVTKAQTVPAIGVLPVLGGPILAGLLTQVLKPSRAIWISGGGALIFVLIMIDRTLHRGGDVGDDLFAPFLGMGLLLLLGALGARIGWRLFRNADPHTPVRVDLPTATTSG